MLKRVFPERSHKSSGKSGVGGGSGSSDLDGNRESSSTTTGSSPNGSPLRSAYDLIGVSSSSRTGGGGSGDSSTTSSPVKSSSPAPLLTKSKNTCSSRSCSPTEFQSLKLESMSTVEDFKSVSKTISSALDLDILAKQAAAAASGGTHNDPQGSSLLSTPSDTEGDGGGGGGEGTENMFKQQAQFFCQMKEYLLSQQNSLRQHLELLNATVALKKKRVPRRQRFPGNGNAKPKSSEGNSTAPEIRGNNHELDLMNEFHSCSSTEKSDEDMQVCPLCGVEIEDSDNAAAALEEHVASHWCSPDDPI